MTVTGISANRLELLQIADAVAREKSIDKEIVVQAIEEAIEKAPKTRYGAEHDIRVHIDPKTGETTITRVVTVVEDDAEEFNPDAQRRLADALASDPEAELGKTYVEILPPFEFGRVQTQMARQVVTGKVRDAERERQYEEFKDRVGEIVNGVAKRVEYGNVIVDLGRGEGIMRRDQSIPREMFQVGDRVRSLHLRRAARSQGPPDHALARSRRASWPSCSPRKCPRSMTASSRSAPSPAILAAAPRWRSFPMTLHRSGRRLRGHARLAGAGGGRRAAGREDRHHPVESR